MEISRYQINQQVRTVLIRHRVDLTMIDYSYIGGTVYLSGTIQKDSGDEFMPAAFESLAGDIIRLQNVTDVQFDLTNWNVNRGRGFWDITKRTGNTSRHSADTPHKQGAISTDRTHEVQKSESIKDVLKDILNKDDKDDDKDKDKRGSPD